MFHRAWIFYNIMTEHNYVLLSIYCFFFHPDYTVGNGLPPFQSHWESRTFTADREFHPALKKHLYFNVTKITL